MRSDLTSGRRNRGRPLLNAVRADRAPKDQLVAAAQARLSSLWASGRLLLASSGGSATDQHHRVAGNRGGFSISLCNYVFEVPSADAPRAPKRRLVLGHTRWSPIQRILFHAGPEDWAPAARGPRSRTVVLRRWTTGCAADLFAQRCSSPPRVGSIGRALWSAV